MNSSPTPNYVPQYAPRSRSNELMMSDQRFRIPFHSENHRSSMRPQIPPNRYHPYRPDLCLRFRRGDCNYGDNCRFVHSIGDFRPEPLPRFENPSSRSRMIKTGFCWNYANGGQCPYGERCNFIHDNSSESVAIRVLNRGGRGGGGVGSGGDCKSKKQVYQRPVALKTRLCKNWEANGSCPFSHSCKFAHGESELIKSKNDNASAHVTTPKKQWVFKWTDIDKISRMYADWIENTPLVHNSSDTMRN